MQSDMLLDLAHLFHQLLLGVEDIAKGILVQELKSMFELL